jgi:hypothetical protein
VSTALRPGADEAAIADAVRAAVLACPAVVALHPGRLVHRTVTYLPGRRIDGVHVEDHRIAVSVVGLLGVPLVVLVDQVRTAVAPLAPGRAVDVHVADLSTLADQPPALPAGSPA